LGGEKKGKKEPSLSQRTPFSLMRPVAIPLASLCVQMHTLRKEREKKIRISATCSKLSELTLSFA